MDKTAVKNFAVWARNRLIADVEFKASFLGITELGIAPALPQSTKEVQYFDIGTKKPAAISGEDIRMRNEFADAIQEKEKDSDYKTAYHFIVEKVAYTWFNRLVAIRFMEVNDYLPSQVRVLSSETPGKSEPDMVTKPYDLDFLSEAEQAYAMDLRNTNRLDELFRWLFIRQCHELNKILPVLFDTERSSWMDILLTISFTDKDGVLWHLVHDIREQDFKIRTQEDEDRLAAGEVSEEDMPAGQVEIIGWLYQYYNTEPKDRVFADQKKNIKVSKENIPAATQLFTPDWIVRYMVENSLGRLWLEGHPSDSLRQQWKYYLDEPPQEPAVQLQLTEIRKVYAELQPEGIRIIDPCMGSGHFLCYLFDVLMQIYESQGWSAREAALSIVENNLYGLDIDERAAQLAYFSVMMKARQYNRRIFSSQVDPHVYELRDGSDIKPSTIQFFADGNPDLLKDIRTVIDALKDVKEFGSLLTVPDGVNFPALYARFKEIQTSGVITAETDAVITKLWHLVKEFDVLHQKYDITITNPPYMGSGNMNAKLVEYLKNAFPSGKSDLFSSFMERSYQFTKSSGFTSLITMESWMFLSTFEKLRLSIYASKTIINMVHMPYLGKGNTSLGINFGTAAVVMRNSLIQGYVAQYEYTVYYETNTSGVPFVFPTINSRWKTAKQASFSMIPGSPVAYWTSHVDIFKSEKLGTYIDARIGMISGNNDRFLRLWSEISFEKIEFGALPGRDPKQKKWYPLQKGGDVRHWYGNLMYVINWENDGYELKFDNSLDGRVRSHNYNGTQQFKEGITWNSITSGTFHCRYSPAGFTYDAAGPLCEVKSKDLLFIILAMLSSKVAIYLFAIINPTINFPSGYLESLPLILPSDRSIVDLTAKECVKLEKDDWNSFETSWDFIRHPLIRGLTTVQKSFEAWKLECDERFQTLKANEEELNRIFIDIYGLQDELTPEVEEKDVTVRKADLSRDIRSLVSYAVGCMFGRYSLDMDGISYAGGQWDDGKYSTFKPVTHNCLVITDERWMEEDIVTRFVDFIRTVYGKDTLEENLTFIAQALGTRGQSSRDKIRNYFVTGFYKDHVKTYQKRPIYWLFDSGKQNGFKALVYMHRWDADTAGRVRVDYLHALQGIYVRQMETLKSIVDSQSGTREAARAAKQREKLSKQLIETREYDERLTHVALSRVDIDLDDGVKVNYQKVQKGPDGRSLDIFPKL